MQVLPWYISSHSGLWHTLQDKMHAWRKDWMLYPLLFVQPSLAWWKVRGSGVIRVLIVPLSQYCLYITRVIISLTLLSYKLSSVTNNCQANKVELDRSQHCQAKTSVCSFSSLSSVLNKLISSWNRGQRSVHNVGLKNRAQNMCKIFASELG